MDYEGLLEALTEHDDLLRFNLIKEIADLREAETNFHARDVLLKVIKIIKGE